MKLDFLDDFDWLSRRLWWQIVAFVVVAIIVLRIAAESQQRRIYTPAPPTSLYSHVVCYAEAGNLICPNQGAVAPTPRGAAPPQTNLTTGP